MSYRLLRVCISGPYYKHFFSFADSMKDLSFDEAMQRCRENGFLYPGRFKAEMEKQGVEVLDLKCQTSTLPSSGAADTRCG